MDSNHVMQTSQMNAADVVRQPRSNTTVGYRNDGPETFQVKAQRKKSVHFADNFVECVDDSSDDSNTQVFA